MTNRKEFDIETAIPRIRKAVKPFPPAALFQLYDEGYSSTFEQLLACMISIRTRDETTIPVAHALFELARTPAQLDTLSVQEIDRAIAACSFHEPKARQMKQIARRALDEFHGEIPCDETVILSLPGIGPKCGNLVLGLACGIKRIGVDIHVHRVTNRWGYVSAPTPERTMDKLADVLPKKYWVEINRLLVPFGKHICTGTLPHCATCVVLDMCRQIGVENHR